MRETLSDVDLAAQLAELAGQILLDLRTSGLFDEKSLGKAGDRTANQFLLHALRHQRPNDGVLSEEEIDDAERLARHRVWIIDPLDGTREYGENRSDWAVHIALAIDGAPVVGAVALPSRGLVLRADRPGIVPPPPDRLRVVVSRTRPPKMAIAVANALGAELVPMGSAGAKAMAVALGEADIYLHAGGQYEWDNCAPAAVAIAHNLHVTRLDGSEMRYNQRAPYLPDLLICRKHHATQIMDLVARLGRDAH